MEERNNFERLVRQSDLRSTYKLLEYNIGQENYFKDIPIAQHQTNAH